MGEKKVLKLSDAFIMKDLDPAVELKVKVININPEQNHEVLHRCKVLKEYSIFMDTIRKYQDTGEERYSKLLIKLTAEGKTDEILKVAQNSEFREKLYKEYKL